MTSDEKLELAQRAIKDLIFLAQAEQMVIRSWGLKSGANYEGIMERARDALVKTGYVDEVG